MPLLPPSTLGPGRQHECGRAAPGYGRRREAGVRPLEHRGRVAGVRALARDALVAGSGARARRAGKGQHLGTPLRWISRQSSPGAGYSRATAPTRTQHWGIALAYCPFPAAGRTWRFAGGSAITFLSKRPAASSHCSLLSEATLWLNAWSQIQRIYGEREAPRGHSTTRCLVYSGDQCGGAATNC